jgi:hypothetical protein
VKGEGGMMIEKNINMGIAINQTTQTLEGHISFSFFTHFE